MYMNRKGVQFSRRDTWCLFTSMKPVIAAGLKKFIEVTRDNEYEGIPSMVIDDKLSHEDNLKVWREMLDKMYYAFAVDEPDIMKYDFEFIWGDEGYDKLARVTNPDEYERYGRDEEEHFKRVQEGTELFGKYAQCLWW